MKRSLNKQEELSSHPQHERKKPGMMAHLSSVSAGDTDAEDAQELLARITESGNSQAERETLCLG